MNDANPLLTRAHDIAARFLDELPNRPVRARDPIDLLHERAAVPLSARGESAESVIDALDALSGGGTIASAGPRYFGFVVGGSYPVALAADWLVSTWDQNPGIHALSPMTAAIELAAGDYVLDLLGLPRDASVGFVTGCQMANFTALAAARHRVLARAGWDVEADGIYGAPEVHVVLGAEAHVTIHTALRYLGFGAKRVHVVEADAQGRMKPEALARTLAPLDGPIIVCAQAGNVNTGAFDPLGEIAAIAHAKQAWVHVDGAFGLWARASRSLASLAAGADACDSWATDAHKWLNVPYDCGIVVVKDVAAHRAAMSVRAAYLVHGAVSAERDALEFVPEFSRRARSIPAYATLRHLGRDGVAALVDRCCGHARRFADALAREPGVAVLNDVVLNQVLVRFGDDDAKTQATIARVQDEGTCWLGGSNWKGRGVMRISLSNWSTTDADVDRSVAAIVAAWRAVASA